MIDLRVRSCKTADIVVVHGRLWWLVIVLQRVLPDHTHVVPVLLLLLLLLLYISLLQLLLCRLLVLIDMVVQRRVGHFWWYMDARHNMIGDL